MMPKVGEWNFQILQMDIWKYIYIKVVDYDAWKQTEVSLQVIQLNGIQISQ